MARWAVGKENYFAAGYYAEGFLNFFSFLCVSHNLSQRNGLVNRRDGLDNLFERDGSMYCEYLFYNRMLIVSTLPDIGALGRPDPFAIL